MEEQFIKMIEQLLKKLGNNSKAEAKLTKQLNSVLKTLQNETQTEADRVDNAKKED
jgi:ElaB/YqjD/DUF883 family membrane-anchored ribosome-binding protein